MTTTTINDVLSSAEPSRKAKWCVQALALTFWRVPATEPDPGDPTKEIEVDQLQFGVTAYQGSTQLGFAHVNGRSEAERANLYRKSYELMEFAGQVCTNAASIENLTAIVEKPGTAGPYLLRLSAWVGGKEKYAWVWNAKEHDIQPASMPTECPSLYLRP